ncbi:MAG: acetyl-CoA carboxylase carboxyltransferase subunit alpha [Kyrpidia tusciae]|nr:acetyl-CoA carboxylase carboxyltransferase subunit alpha [Kyrpidia tusciae]MBE3551767.1 acetyl-CoA carboxylase carboxyltransferase subunit alpha [Kyrpidia tusciae]
MAGELPFEKPLLELERKIEELKRFTETQQIDLGEEVTRLEERAKQLAEEIYGHLTPYQKVQIARHPDRPTTLDYIHGCLDAFLELHGDRLFGDDQAIVGGIGLLQGRPVTVVGHQRGRDTKENLARNFGMPHPEGFRKALRLMKEAERFHRPVLCFIDTSGAYPGITSEERGIGMAIADNLIEMATLSIPLLCVVTGEGGSGGALALGMGDRVYMLEHAVYSVISVEGAAALLWKDAGQAPRAAESMRITAQDLLRLGVIDGVIEEPLGGAHKDPPVMVERVKAAIIRGLNELTDVPGDELVRRRYDRFRAMGRFEEG